MDNTIYNTIDNIVDTIILYDCIKLRLINIDIKIINLYRIYNLIRKVLFVLIKL